MSDSSNVHWEYTVLSVRGNIAYEEYTEDFIKRANILGQEGWELIISFDLTHYIFKRRLP